MQLHTVVKSEGIFQCLDNFFNNIQFLGTNLLGFVPVVLQYVLVKIGSGKTSARQGT